MAMVINPFIGIDDHSISFIFLIEMAGNQGSMAVFTGVPVQTFDIIFLYISISILVSATHIQNLSGHG